MAMEFFEKDFGKILKSNAQQMRHDLLPQGTNCFRVYDRNLVQFPVTVDLYGKYAKVTDYGEDGPLSSDMLSSCVDICARMLYLEHENIIYSYRAKRSDKEQHEKTEESSIDTVVDENNLHFKVDLATYVDTGLFLDHRLTRMLVKERSMNADVLNLFSYTGSFSVYAAAGGANSVKSIDMSATYTKWAQENLAQNGFEGTSYQCVCMDATKYIAQAITLGEKYDIIIFDPPCFSNSRKMDNDFDVARDYAKWIKDLTKLLKKTGFILFSTNLGSFRMDRRQLRGLSVKEITGAVQAPGFAKGRKGTARSWMMALDDDSLKLDWSEPSEKPRSEKGSDKRASERKPERERRGFEKKSYSDRKDADRKDGERNYHEHHSERRSGERSYGERSYRDRNDGERSYGSRDRHYSRSYDDKPYGARTYKERTYEDRREYSSRFDHDDRYRNHGENSERSYGRREDRGYRSRDRQDRDERGYKSERSERHYDRSESSDRPRYDKSERFDRYDRRSARDSYKERSFGSRSSSTPYKGRDEKSESRTSKSAKKPYGYDSFKSARSRDDSADFFWNTDDLENNSKN